MATVYSLICWGGKDGKTATMTVASPCVVTITNHGLRDGAGVVFSTTGALPTGVTAGTTYYAKSIAANTFNLYTDAALTTIVNTSGSQSGTHTAQGAYYLGLADKSRWTTDSTERVYNGIVAWRAARYSVAGTYDTEVCEIGEAFDDYVSSQTNINIPAANVVITPKVNGVYTGAFHGGVFGAGYTIYCRVDYNAAVVLSGYRHTIEGIGLYTNVAFGICAEVSSSGIFNTIYNCLFLGSGASTQIGLRVSGSANVVCNCIVNGFTDTGLFFVSYSGNASIYSNNLAVKCNKGFLGTTYETRGWFFNNISVGNTTNWSTAPTYAYAMANNYGVSGDTPWALNGTSFATMSTTDFVDFTGNDFRPAASSSPQVEGGITVLGVDALDVLGDIRPNYVSATHPNESWDAGPFEFDHGEGLAPLSVPISITGMASGSEFAVYKSSDMSAILSPQSTSGSYSGTYTYTGDTNIIVRVRKGTASTRYLPYEYAGTITSTGFQLVVSQVVDTIAQ